MKDIDSAVNSSWDFWPAWWCVLAKGPNQQAMDTERTRRPNRGTVFTFSTVSRGNSALALQWKPRGRLGKTSHGKLMHHPPFIAPSVTTNNTGKLVTSMNICLWACNMWTSRREPTNCATTWRPVICHRHHGCIVAFFQLLNFLMLLLMMMMMITFIFGIIALCERSKFISYQVDHKYYPCRLTCSVSFQELSFSV